MHKVRPEIRKSLKKIEYVNLAQMAADGFSIFCYAVTIIDKLYAQKKILERDQGRLLAKSIEYIAEICSDMITDTNYFIDVMIRFFIRQKLRKALKILWSEEK